MEKIILDALSEKSWMWIEELKLHFMLCDPITHYTFINPEFDSAFANLLNKGLIKVINRLEIKGYYKKTGEIVELVNPNAIAKKC